MSLSARYGGVALCDAVTQWYQRSFEDDRPSHGGRGAELAQSGVQDAIVNCKRSEIRVGIGPDPGTARALAF
jgi:hypothetical protein